MLKRLFSRKPQEFKNVSIPAGEANLIATQLWEVRWTSRHGSFNGETKPEIEVFFNEQDAIKFAQALRAAFMLLRHTSETVVAVSKVR